MKTAPKPDDLAAMVAELGTLQERTQALKARIKEAAERQAQQAATALARLGMLPATAGPPVVVPTVSVAPAPASERKRGNVTETKVPNRGQGDRIVAVLVRRQDQVGTPATIPEIVEGLGMATHSANRKRIGIALCRLRKDGRVEGGRGGWRIAGAPKVSNGKGTDEHARMLRLNGKSTDEHAQAIAWARAHPDDPRAAKALEINRR